jgi:hypothetical protein
MDERSAGTMSHRSLKPFLLFYVAFTFLFQIERTQSRLESLANNRSQSPAIQAQSPHATLSRITEDGFVLHGFEDVAALPETTANVVSIPLSPLQSPGRLSALPRSPPMNKHIA